MNKLLTIVVPVYNVEKYINKCLDSCILSSPKLMSLLEVIIINDGTPDNSAELSREYTLNYPQTFRQIDKENGGHGSAWNVGLKEATGKYLRFLDSDDWLTNLDLLIQKLADTDADIVFTNYVRHYMDTNTSQLFTVDSVPNHICPLNRNFLWTQKDGAFVMNFWKATYKTSILKPLYPLFAEKIQHDDSILESAPLLYGKNYLYLDFVVYNYLLGRPGQTMDPKVMRKTVDHIVACQKHWKTFYCKYHELLEEDLVECVKRSMRNHARHYLQSMLYLPYGQAKTAYQFMLTEAFPDGVLPRRRQTKLYNKLPFILFYFIIRFHLLFQESSLYQKLRKHI